MTGSSKLIILEGSSGSGKSSLAAALQECLLPGVWLSFSMDTLIYTLPPSVLHRCNSANDWSGVDGRAIDAAALCCLKALVECGNNVIFDLCIPSQQYADAFQSEIQDLSPVKVGVRCDWREIERRTLQRADRSIEEAERTFKQQHPFQNYDFVIDTTAISPDAAAMECLASFRHFLDGPTFPATTRQAHAEQCAAGQPSLAAPSATYSVATPLTPVSTLAPASGIASA